MAPKIEITEEMDLDDYSEAVSFLWRIAYKFNLIAIIGSLIEEVVNNPSKFPHISCFGEDDRLHLASLLSIQVVALTYELTENCDLINTLSVNALNAEGSQRVTWRRGWELNPLISALQADA